MRRRAPTEGRVLMTTESSASEHNASDVEEVAERHGLGSFRQTLIPRKRRLLRGSGGKAKGFLHEFENGVVYQDVDDDGPGSAFPWAEVSSVYVGSTRKYVNGTYGGTEYGCTAVLANGGKLVLSGWFRDPALGRVPAKHDDDEYRIFLLMSSAATTVSRAQLPDAVARLERGEALTFGEMVISRFGVGRAVSGKPSSTWQRRVILIPIWSLRRPTGRSGTTPTSAPI